MKLTDEQKDELFRLYLEGATAEALAPAFGLTTKGVTSLLGRYGVRRRKATAGRIRSLNESAFDSLTEEARYFIGLLMADGCVTYDTVNHTYQVILELEEKDAAHVERFRRFLGSSHKLRSVQSKPPSGNRLSHRVRLAVNSKRMVERLMSFGVTPRKSHTARVIGLEHDRHFWRGVVDGDGSLGVNGRGYPFFHLIGSESLAHQFKEFVRENVPDCRAKVGVSSGSSNCFTFQTAGSYAPQIIRLLYEDCAVALPRKLERAKAIIRDYEELEAERHALEEAQLKTCSRCGASKPYADFSPHKVHTDGLDSTCKQCRASAAREKRAARSTARASVGQL